VAGDLPNERPDRVVPDYDAGVEAYSTGAIRSLLGPRYDLVPSVGVRRVAEAMAYGASKYGEGNWTRGMPVKFLLNHALAHIFQYLDGDASEDHLGHAAANMLMACHSAEKWPKLNRLET
jgi:hypothetical protein